MLIVNVGIKLGRKFLVRIPEAEFNKTQQSVSDIERLHRLTDAQVCRVLSIHITPEEDVSVNPHKSTLI